MPQTAGTRDFCSESSLGKSCLDKSCLDKSCLDLAHLDRQTGGDLALAHELLTLFTARSQDVLAQIYALATGPMQDRRAFRDLAHQLKGSALAIGAFEIAAAAAATEESAADSVPEAAADTLMGSALDRLAAAHIKAGAAIKEHLQQLEGKI